MQNIKSSGEGSRPTIPLERDQSRKKINSSQTAKLNKRFKKKQARLDHIPAFVGSSRSDI